MEDIENVIPRLEEFLCSNVAWLVETVQNLLPDADFSHAFQMTDERGKVSAIIQQVRRFHIAEWRDLIDYICMYCQLPLDLEAQLISLAGG